MNRAARLLFLALLCVVLPVAAGCSRPAPQAAPNTGGGADSGIIVGVEGAAALKRAGWCDYAPAIFGAAFRRGDLLRTEGGASARIACADLAVAGEMAGERISCPACDAEMVVPDRGPIRARRLALDGACGEAGAASDAAAQR